MKSIRADYAEYLQSHLYDEYVSENGERPGLWLGSGAAELKLRGAVEPVVQQLLMKGMSPDGTKPLIQHAAIASGNHIAGIDLVFNLPKSISMGLMSGDPRVPTEIVASANEATKLTVKYAEETVAFTRRGKAGERLEPCKLVVSAHVHLDNRNNEPHVHVHTIFYNVTVRNDLTTGTLVTQPFFDRQMELRYFWLNAAVTELRKRLGLEIVAEGRSYRAVGISKEMEKAFSTRTTETRQEMKARGTSGPKAADEAAKATQRPKQHLAFDIKLSAWRDKAASLGLTEERLSAIFSPARQQTLQTIRQERVSETPEIKLFAPQRSVLASVYGNVKRPVPREVPPVHKPSLHRLVLAAAEAKLPRDGIDRLIDHLIDDVPKRAAVSEVSHVRPAAELSAISGRTLEVEGVQGHEFGIDERGLLARRHVGDDVVPISLGDKIRQLLNEPLDGGGFTSIHPEPLCHRYGDRGGSCSLDGGTTP